LNKHFGKVKAVDAISLSFEPRQMVGVIGRSGAGKSILLRLIYQLEDPTDGEIWSGDIRITDNDCVVDATSENPFLNISKSFQSSNF
jgi:ABC-type sugar transport system ATPase subunit